MALIPLDTQSKIFPTKMRGCSQDEVDDFLGLVVRDYEELIQRNRELEKTVKHSEEKLEYFNELKDALNQLIIVAQDTAGKVKTGAGKESEAIATSARSKVDELVTNTERHAHQLTTGAEERAGKILAGAIEKARQLATETEDLKKKIRVFHQRISLMLESQSEQVKNSEWDEILQPFSSYVTDSHEVIKEVLAKQLDNENDTDVNSDTGVIETPMTALDTQTIDISIIPGEHEDEQDRKVLCYSQSEPMRMGDR